MIPINILIVEDEAEILSGMQHSLQSMDDKFHSVFTVTSAEAALEIVQCHYPSVIVSDIVLPNLSGLDLVSHIKMMSDYHPKILMISGYSDFQYAKRSIQLGVVDYLLKPFPKEDFCGKIASLIELIREEEQEQIRLNRQKELANHGTQTLRDKFLLDCLLHKTTLQETIYHRLQFWNLDWLTHSSYVVIAIDKQEQWISTQHKEEMALHYFAIRNIAEEVVKNYTASLVIQNQAQICIVTAHADAEEMMTDIHRKVLAYQRISIVYGLSQRMSSFHLLHDAYSQAIKACQFAVLNAHTHIVHYSELKYYSETNGDLLKDHLVQVVYAGERERISTCMEHIFNSMIIQKLDHPHDIVRKSMEMVIELHVLLRDSARISLDQVPISLWENLEKDGNFERIKKLITAYFQEVGKQIAQSSTNAIILKAKQIIEDNNTKEITLQGLAEQLSISPVWLSHLFKKETGQTFQDYVTELRVEKAKHLLRETNLKIYEICTELGYLNLQHFGMMFKKRTGLTPKEFRYGK